MQGRALGRIFCPPGGMCACVRNYTGSWFAEWANEYSFMVYFMGCISVGEPVCTVTPCFRLFKMQGGCIAALLPTTHPVDMPWSQGSGLCFPIVPLHRPAMAHFAHPGVGQQGYPGVFSAGVARVSLEATSCFFRVSVQTGEDREESNADTGNAVTAPPPSTACSSPPSFLNFLMISANFCPTPT